MNTKERYERSRNTYCWLGFILGVVGNVTSLFSQGFGWLIVVPAVILSVVGCYNWAKAKGRSSIFCLWGVLAPIGYLGVAFMEDRSMSGVRQNAGGST